MTKEDIKPNSYAYKEAQKKKTSTQGAQIRKKTLIDKAAEAFTPADRQSVGEFLVKEVIIPNAKDLIFSIVSNGLSMWLWDDARGGSGYRPRSGIIGQVGNIPYNRMFQGSGKKPSEQNVRTAQRVSTVYQLTEDITYANMQMARTVLDELIFVIQQQGFVTVGDMYEIADKVTYQFTGDHLEYSVPFTAHSYGWTDLSTIRPKNIHGRWILPYPDPQPVTKR